MNASESFGVSILRQIQNDSFAQVSLMTYAGPPLSYPYLTDIVKGLLCHQKGNPCEVCFDCQSINREDHPDWFDIKAENNLIKIDVVRDLAIEKTKMSHRGRATVVTIRQANALNESAANALLKIIEEPPSHLYFILWTEDSKLVLPTLLSRCQKMTIPYQFPTDLNTLIASFEVNHPRRILLESLPKFAPQIKAVIERRDASSALYRYWSTFWLDDVLWFLSWLISGVLSQRLSQKAFIPLAISIFENVPQHTMLFETLDKISQNRMSLHQNMNFNAALCFDSLLLPLMGYAVP